MWVLKQKNRHHGRLYKILPFVIGFGLGIVFLRMLKL